MLENTQGKETALNMKLEKKWQCRGKTSLHYSPLMSTCTNLICNMNSRLFEWGKRLICATAWCMIQKRMEKPRACSNKLKSQHKIRGVFDHLSPERDKSNSQIRFHLAFLHPFTLYLNFYKVHIKSRAPNWHLNIQHLLICLSGLLYNGLFFWRLIKKKPSKFSKTWQIHLQDWELDWIWM